MRADQGPQMPVGSPLRGQDVSPLPRHHYHELDDAVAPIDLTTSRGSPQQRLPAVKRYWRNRTVRRNREKLADSEQFNQSFDVRGGPREMIRKAAEVGRDSEFTYISGPKYFFQRFIRQYPVGALSVWVVLFLVELAMVVLYIVETTRPSKDSWVSYDSRDKSLWFYARFVLSLVSLLQLFFAYSLDVMSITVVVSTSIYQIILFFVAVDKKLAWVSRIYVPFFLRCWPLRQYFLFILDSVAIMSTRNRKLDLLRLTIGPLSLFVCMVFTAAECFRIDQTFRGYPLNVAEAVYYLVVTVSTVGYGDITPKTPEGKAITIVIIFVFVAKMPTFIQVIRSTATILRAFRSYKGRRNHFLVYGLVTREEAISILDEVFCLYPMKSVCFCNKEFSPDVIAIGRHPTYRLRSTFLIMDSLDAFALGRMKAAEAAAVIIFPVREGYSSRVDDDVMLSSLIFERLVPDLPQYVWLRYGLHAKLLKGQRASMIDEHMKKNIMATSLLLPGIVPFLVNLVRTAWAEGEEPTTLWLEEGIEDWQHQYEYSRRNVISTCMVPTRFVNTKLRVIASKFKYQDVLIVGVEESERKIMRLDLDYVVEENDVLVAIYERRRNSLAKALENFAQLGPLDELRQHEYGTHFRQGLDDDELLRQNMNESFVFYPYSSSPDLAGMAAAADAEGSRRLSREEEELDDAGADAACERNHGGEGDSYGTGINESDVKKLLAEAGFTDKDPSGVPLAEVPLDQRTVCRLSYLMKRREGALNDPYSTEEERRELVANLEDQVNTAVISAADDYLTALEQERALAGAQPHHDEEVFLFVDQTTSILRKTNMSVYEDVISQTIAQYELYSMMQCISSIHLKSRLSLLTLRKYPPEFLKAWKEIFGTPLRYIRGQGSLDSHLNFAITADSSAAKVRGILLYCSQMGPRDFGDVPIFSVENSVRDLLEWNERAREGLEELPEQNIMVELQSFTSSIKVSPFHSRAEWRQRGESNFQDSLAFMMGRCFSSNMMGPLMIHCHRDSRIVSFMELVLNLTSTAEMFDITSWANRPNQSQTLFKLCGNQSLQFQTFGDAYEFLLEKRKCVAIGVFRQFPASENLRGNPRYFVTNPPLQMPLLVEDIVYCLDASGSVFASN